MGNRKLPFGYKMVMGEIIIHPQEAQAVQGIYARYLAGASFNNITDHLKEKGPPYDADKPWNKNMVARILEDNRYAGTERFPTILTADQMKEVARRRSERKPTVQITEAQKALRRLCNGRPSTAVESQVLSLLNCLAAAPEQIKPQPQTVNRGELAEMERRFSAALTTSPVDEDGAKEIALRLAGMQYSAIGSSEYNHEAIIDRKTYDAVQTELARRNALKGNTQKSTPSGRSCYTPKYALSDRVICGECGTLYRRCTWVNRGKKHIVWRCISRFDYGKKYCHDSPAVDEQQLQQAILRVINSIMTDKPTLVRQVTENLQVVIRPSRSGELTIADIDHQLEVLAREFDAAFATAATGNAADYSERFKIILTQQTELKAKRAELEQQQAEDAELTSHMELAADTLEQAGTAITEWDEYQIRALVESVRILSKDEILVLLKSGIEKIERLQR